MMDIRDILCDMGHEEAVLFDCPDYDDAIVGVTDESRVVYDWEAMVDILVERDGMIPDEAIDFLEYNMIRAIPYAGECAPIVMVKLDRETSKKEYGGSKTMKIKINTHGNAMPEAIENGDWIDLRAAETVEMRPLDFRVISLGVSMELPEGYEAHIVPRSSTFKKWGILLVNSMGIIDNSYRGDNDIWGFPALAMRHTVIKEGDRICQFRIVKKQEPIEWEPVNSLGNQDRGGFGSTGDR